MAASAHMKSDHPARLQGSASLALFEVGGASRPHCRSVDQAIWRPPHFVHFSRGTRSSCIAGASNWKEFLMVVATRRRYGDENPLRLVRPGGAGCPHLC